MVGDLSVREFGERLASASPTPGGGSAAALGGALGAGLVSMVCNFTVGREKYADVEDEMQAVLRRSEELRLQLEQAVEDDVAAYGGYSEASKLPRSTDEESAARDAALDAALRESTLVPLGVAERCAELLELALRAAELGNRFLISDAAVGAELAAAARASAELNVRLNVGGIDDAAFADGVRGRLEAVRERVGGRELVDRTVAVVEERAGG
ncbi:MAG TPA: cyclodeaminase/cyclohydrolase family protein [Thermoleophilaceae bacterium]|nr:cyclodeaminase/cyclohydrolase family protein [Thermoleophilaceae bacterium]